MMNLSVVSHNLDICLFSIVIIVNVFNVTCTMIMAEIQKTIKLSRNLKMHVFYRLFHSF